MVRFITLAGKKQTGKDTSAEFIKQLLTTDNRDLGERYVGKPGPRFEPHQIHITHFADALKKACNVIFGVPLEYMETEEGKQKLTHVRWPTDYGNYIEPTLKSDNYQLWRPDDTGQPMTVREVLQFVGTELFRNQIDPDVWLNSVFLQPWQDDDIVIIADARFPNEAALGRESGLLIKVERDTGLISDGHKSENALDDFTDYHYTVNNNGSFEELKMHLEAILVQRRFIINA